MEQNLDPEQVLADPGYVKYLDKKMEQLRNSVNDFDQFLELARRKGFIIKYPGTFKRVYWDPFDIFLKKTP